MNHYNQASENTNKYAINPAGKSSFEALSETDNILIAQNNTMIKLLLIIIEKLDNSQPQKDYARQLDEISEKFKNHKVSGQKPRIEL